MSKESPLLAGQAWSTTAETYSSNVGRISALAAARLVDLVAQCLPFAATSQVLDNGAGTGAVTFTLASRFPSVPILATDISAPMLSNISSAQLSSVSTRVADALSLSQELAPSSFSHVFNTFMLQTITHPSAALREMHTVLRPNGLIGIALWAQRIGPFEIWKRACQSIDPGYVLPAPFDDPHAWRTCEELEYALGECDFENVTTEVITMPFPFETTEKFVEFWFEAKNPAAEKCISSWKGDKAAVRKAVEKVCQEDFGDGKDICTWAVLGVGRKP